MENKGYWAVCLNYNNPNEQITLGEGTTQDYYSVDREKAIDKGKIEIGYPTEDIKVTQVSSDLFYLGADVGCVDCVIAWTERIDMPADLDGIIPEDTKKRIGKLVLMMAAAEKLSPEEMADETYMDDKLDTWINFDMI